MCPTFIFVLDGATTQLAHQCLLYDHCLQWRDKRSSSHKPLQRPFGGAWQHCALQLRYGIMSSVCRARALVHEMLSKVASMSQDLDADGAPPTISFPQEVTLSGESIVMKVKP